MAKSIPALINPAILIWAREKAGLTPDEAAKSIGVKTEKLLACEAGEQHLTFPQFLAAANCYKRAPSLFYLEQPPTDFQPIQDFRRLSSAQEGTFTPKLTYAIRQARERRELALGLREELGDPIQSFTLTGEPKESEEDLGQRIRTFLGVTEDEQLTWRAKAFEKWRSAIEAKDVLVFMIPRVPLAEMRGVAVAEDRLPIILINGQDRTNGRVFTLLHEFCHLVIRASGVSGFGTDDSITKTANVERFCNATAAAALVPKDWLLNEPLVTRKGTQKTWEDEELAALAVRFGVSREVVLRRLLTLGRTTKHFYESRRSIFQKEYDDLAEKKTTGGPPHHLVVLSQLGRNFTQLVFQGYHERRLTLRDVANYFNMQVKSVPTMEQAAFGLER